MKRNSIIVIALALSANAAPAQQPPTDWPCWRRQKRTRRGWAQPSDPLEPDREHPLVREVAGVGHKLARGLPRPRVRHESRERRRQHGSSHAVFRPPNRQGALAA